MATEQIKPTNIELVEALGADSVEYHKGGFRLLVGGKTVAYGQELAKEKGVRLRVLIESLPATLTKGLKVEPIATKKQLSVWIESTQAAKVRPILDRVVASRAKETA